MSKDTKGMLSAGRPSSNRKAATLASLVDDKGPTTRVNFDLDREVHKRLKMMAVEQDKTVADILRELVTQSLK